MTEKLEICKNGNSFSVIPHLHEKFWKKVQANDWEPETFQVFDKYLSPSQVYVDIGAWIGSTLLYASQIAKRSIAYEPDPLAFDELRANLEANSTEKWAQKIIVYNMAVAQSPGKRRLSSRKDGGDSMSSLQITTGKTSWEVEATTLEKIISTDSLEEHELFVKIDIEGGEYELKKALVKLLRHPRITLYLSLHPHLKSHGVQGSKLDKKKITTRLILAWNQLLILHPLRNSFCRKVNGERLSIAKELWAIVTTGSYARSVIAGRFPAQK